uniref:DNA-directed DNA polymerase n=1 Tax=freshwater metagenome TaxID=449393 RepID=A0A6J5ZM59_9ZZZZ
MSAAPSLYRRHRPRNFSDVVGQEHVVRTLTNAVTQESVHHAYLFVGSRGTGKTSMAKILAACLNCEQGPTAEPCGVCDSCLSIQQAGSMDVIEMDGASHNSVDDIRELRESVAYAPVSGRSKVYIIDEAQMLTPQAWNAFLKTLEEPPPNTIFVLATTEPQKILDTVVDRCHRFDFGRPTVEQLTVVLQRVAGEEQIEISADALALIARHATGSFRDALGTLEQLVTYSGSTVAVEDVLAVLGVADDDLLFGALDAVSAHDARAALEIAARLAQTGRDLQIAARDLEVHTRELLVVRTLGAVPAELRVTPDRDARLSEQADRVEEADAVRLLDLLGASMRAIRDGADPRTQLELALVKAATPEVDASTKALLARIGRLEQALGGAAPASAPPATPPAAPPAQAPPAEQPPAPPVAEQPPAPAPAEEPPPPAPAAEAAGGQAAAAAAPSPEPEAAPAPEAPSIKVSIEQVKEIWPAVLETIGPEHPMVCAALERAEPVEMRGDGLLVGFDENDSFNRRMISDHTDAKNVVAEAVESLLGGRIRIDYEICELAPRAEAQELAGDELVDHLMETFEAEEIVAEQPAAPEAPAESNFEDDGDPGPEAP